MTYTSCHIPVFCKIRYISFELNFNSPYNYFEQKKTQDRISLKCVQWFRLLNKQADTNSHAMNSSLKNALKWNHHFCPDSVGSVAMSLTEERIHGRAENMQIHCYVGLLTVCFLVPVRMTALNLEAII